MHLPAVTPALAQALIRTVRGVEVLLDADVVRLFGIDARALTECVIQNPALFPADFVFALEGHEIEAMWDQPSGHSDRRPVYAFTEHSLAHVLRLFDSRERGLALVAIFRGFTLYRKLLILSN